MRRMEEKQRQSEELQKMIEQQKAQEEKTKRKMSIDKSEYERQLLLQKMQQIQQSQEHLQCEQEKIQGESRRLEEEREELKRQRRQIEENQKMLQIQSIQNQKKDQFRKEIKDIQRKVVEANECAKFLKKNIKFEIQIVGVIPENISNNSFDQFSSSTNNQQVQIKVENFDNDSIYIWDMKKFLDKLEMIKDMINTVQDNGTLAADNEDPFEDEKEPILIGQAYYKLEPLPYLIDNPMTLSIMGTSFSSYEQVIMGKLEVNIIPVDEDGESEIPDENIPDSP